MATYKHIASLIIKHRNNELTDKERKELEEWCALSEKNQLLFDRLNDDAYMALKRKRLDSIDIDEQWEKISARLPVKKKTPWQVVAGQWKLAAAIVTVLTGAGLWWFWLGRPSASKAPQTAQQLPAKENEKKPVGNRIELKLADGKAVYLDGKREGQIAKQKNAIIYKEGEWLRYAYMTGNEQEAIDHNTITTPKGKTFLLQLSDGSKIWMNAASSITFPTAFTGKERRVQVKGEVYFEVAHRKADIPFIVDITPYVPGIGGCQVEVLGTHFNVNAYNDEGMIKTTLLRGKVRVWSMTKGQSQILEPGEQAQLRATGELKVVQHANEGTMSWKENQFKYDEQDIKLIMRDIARWYDYEVVYNDKAEGHYSFTISRTVKVEQVLEVLEMMSGMHFKVEGRQIIVTSGQG